MITWNDYGEGTIIEPTEEFGYQYLEIVQDTRRSMQADGFLFRPEDLQLPLRLFALRNVYAQDEAIQARLDEVFNALVGGEVNAAVQRLSAFSSSG